ncbi:hypothetical protein CTAM01_15216 [Colletotrichum tamarilloi]|uniref:PRISE-like Rossmann-fold domain-containing protein n=1 Tax=Colletotrichum tamarilloi TaxID=1209934 RepID=A0ABQ9QLZ4_9PEZI|nr:uncharacterized protein CTAM01_15216 [Colletotrichum tamarilloi]KAK1477292.1 hypothetical protein CTAM01_15216 [Colletotrichum tamarilloi]
MVSEKRNGAMMFGASGIVSLPSCTFIGFFSILKILAQLGFDALVSYLPYPSTVAFSQFIGISKRPMGRKTARLEDDPRLKIHTGLDLTDADLTLQRPKATPEVVVLHSYVTAYTGHESDLENPVKINAAIIDNGLAAVKHLCPNLEIVSLQTGGKGYGIVGFGWPPGPWKEDLARLPEPYASKIF